ncbi:nucleoside triphosphate pyrophosphohydrolase [Desulfitobacterium metallireducens]|uniref:Nucleotide pyrophosphohydrolase n=1 Tax=Desulfitobacterium metallireducens DSM 15288 TaxID=871968 RepID=W0E894_9FIRM|nr:nucleoside triphosphate pyrophosphohydrolase [Desulfitobacterium metallireducens]AHF05723.1 nucleotide pyrophosphohydrolase [Desulfitobacterium metallireducens DSM 15288]
MKSTLHVLGLGPAGLESMTLGTYRLILSADKVFVRTFSHPCVQDLLREGAKLESFDEYYEQGESFEEVYEKIVRRLETELKKHVEVIYAVPGHPAVAERSVQLIVDKLSLQFNVLLHPSVSFLDSIFTAVPLDPIQGVLIRNYDALKGSGLTGKEWLIIPQVYSSFIASDVKLDLMDVYPDEAPAIIVQALGTPEQVVQKVKLYELDHQKFDHLTTVLVPPHKDVISMVKLQDVMRTLRAPGGCPWDREQTHETLKPYLIEESYEVLEAIEQKDMYNLTEELGDLLLQVIFHAQLAHEAEEFEFDDILRGIIHKLIHRHPHVFGDVHVDNSEEVLQNWEEIKKQEKGEERAKGWFHFPQALPALMLATKTQKAVAKVGFDWPDQEGPIAKVREEIQELQEAMESGEGIQEEFGDILFALVNLARFLKLDPEDSLRKGVHKFQNRFEKMAELAFDNGEKLENMTLEEMDFYWEKAKIYEKSGKFIET